MDVEVVGPVQIVKDFQNIQFSHGVLIWVKPGTPSDKFLSGVESPNLKLLIIDFDDRQSRDLNLEILKAARSITSGSNKMTVFDLSLVMFSHEVENIQKGYICRFPQESIYVDTFDSGIRAVLKTYFLGKPQCREADYKKDFFTTGAAIEGLCRLNYLVLEKDSLPRVIPEDLTARNFEYYDEKTNEYFTGEVVDGKKHGKGFLFHQEGVVSKLSEGVFINGEMVHGSITYQGHEKYLSYEGAFGTFDGKCHRHGYGRMLLTSLALFSGQFHKGQPHGLGTFTSRDTVKIGSFVNGKKMGKFEVYSENLGKKEIVYFENDQPLP